jgi:hypothetical protein
MADAWRYSVSASSGFPVWPSTSGMRWWVQARTRWNSVTAGLAFAGFCKMAKALRYSVSASSGFPVWPSNTPTPWWLQARPLWNSVTAGLASASF